MKKAIFSLFVFIAVVFAQTNTPVEQEAISVWTKTFPVLAVGLGLGVAALGRATGMGYIAAATIAGTVRNPDLGPKLTTTMLIALAMMEAQVIYALVIALTALYANPFIPFS